jgi:peptide/nickel transport system permease protein
MGKYVLKRVLYALVTLWVLSVAVFLLLNLLPGNPGRRILGNLADERAVQALNDQLGYSDPLITRYFSWLGGIFQGDLGTSYSINRPVTSLLANAIVPSAKLALVAFVIVVPVSVLAGVFAGLRKGRASDRFITVAGLSGVAIPEFVSAYLLVFVFAIKLGWLPGNATADDGAGIVTQVKHLLLPALTLVIVLFGYLARMARSGTIVANESDYARTAELKGLPRRTVVLRHVLRNGLLPTVAVIFTQLGYLIAGLAVVETVFTYPGIGRLVVSGIQQRDFPLLQSTVLVVGAIYLFATLLSDLAIAALNPRVRLADG